MRIHDFRANPSPRGRGDERLTRLHTTRSSSSTHGAATLQDLTYTRDFVGNLTSIADDAQETVYFANTQVSATRAFTHDSLYRLIQATGREKDGLTQTTHELPTAGGLPDSGNPALRRYTQSYEYDEVGNLLEMKHQLGSGGSVLWKRDYTYASGSNRLLTTSMGQTTLDYDYDARGALSNLPHLEGFTRDFRDQLRKVVLDLAGNEAWYAHDGAGQRVRKLVDKGAVTEERIYVGGWEVWRKRVNGTLDEERTTLHVRDGERRVAMVETKTVVDEEPVTTPVARWRFQLDDHLGSAVSECDDEGGVFSYEELHPYGSVAWSAVDSALDVSPRRYRYTGMERDEETGLQAHGVRMYAPWLGRWDRVDPIGLAAGVNRWWYGNGMVQARVDRTGNMPVSAQATSPTSTVEALREAKVASVAQHASVMTSIAQDAPIAEVKLRHFRYLYSERHGWVDMRHFTAAAALTSSGVPQAAVELVGWSFEIPQLVSPHAGTRASAFSREDVISNHLGAAFGASLHGSEDYAQRLANYLEVEQFVNPERAPDWNALPANESEILGSDSVTWSGHSRQMVLFSPLNIDVHTAGRYQHLDGEDIPLATVGLSDSAPTPFASGQPTSLGGARPVGAPPTSFEEHLWGDQFDGAP